MKKWLKIILIIVASLVALVAVALVLVSPVAKGYVNRHGKELIGREIHVDKLRAGVLRGRVRIYNLEVMEDDDQTVFFSFDTLDVSVKLRKLLRQELYVRHITLAEPRVRIVQDGDKFNFSSIIDHFKSDDDEPDDDTTSSDWSLGFYNIRLSEGEVLYADSRLSNEWDLKNLNIKIPGVYFDGSENTDAGITLQMADGGTLRTDASLNMDNNEFAVDLDLEQFAISNVKAYLTDVMNVGRFDGMLNANIDVKGNLSDIMKMVFSGEVTLKDVDVEDNKGVDVLAFSNLAMKVNGISLDDNRYDIKSLALDGLVSHFDILADGNNFSRLFDVKKAHNDLPEVEEEPAEQEGAKQQTSPKPFNLKVGSFAINDAQFTINDYTLPDEFSFPVKKLNIKADDVSSTGDNNARVSAQLPHGGTAMVRWHGNINEWKKSQNLMLNIKNLQLKDLSPYAVAYLGHPFTDGTFSFTSENSIQYSQLNGRNMLDLYNPEVGEKRKDVDAKVNLPLKAALYVLKDKDGKVQFDVPVSGNIDSPEFSYMKIVWKTLGNLVVKVATSPFRAVAKALGKDGELDFIAFDAQRAQFNSEQYSTLNKIAEVLQYDTNIVVTLTPQINMEQSHKAQSLYLLKEEYYISRHPEKANGKVPPQVYLFDEVSAVTVKDTAFVNFLIKKGINTKRPMERDVQRLAEKLYPKDAAVSSLEVLAGYRNDYLKRFFNEQGLSSSRLKVSQFETSTTRTGYVINSEVEGEAEYDYESDYEISYE